MTSPFAVASSLLPLAPPQDQAGAIGQAVMILAFLITGIALAVAIPAVRYQKKRRKERQNQLIVVAAAAGYGFVERQPINYRMWSLHHDQYFYSEAHDLLYKIDDSGLVNIAFFQRHNNRKSSILSEIPPSRRVLFGIYIGGDLPRLSVRRQKTPFFNGGDLDLDSSEFNDNFIVDAADERVATDFLHPGMIDYLMNAYSAKTGPRMEELHLENGWLITYEPLNDTFQGGETYSYNSVNANLNYLRGIIGHIPAWLAKDSGMTLSRPSGHYSPLAEAFPGIMHKIPNDSPARSKDAYWGIGLEQADTSSDNGLSKTIFWGGVGGVIIGPTVGPLLLGALGVDSLFGGGLLSSIFIYGGLGVVVALGIRKLAKRK